MSDRLQYIRELKWHIEMQILGMAMHENQFSVVSWILKAQNFTKGTEYNHQTIWQAMASMWPNTPITVANVNTILIKNYGLKYAYHLVECIDTVYRNTPQYNALVLLELDFRQKLTNEISLLISTAKANHKYDTAADLKDMEDYVSNPTTDFFEAVNDTIRYFEANKMTYELAAMEQFRHLIDKRIDLLKQYNGYENILTELNTIIENPSMNFSQSTAKAMKSCLRVVKNISTGKKLDTKTLTTLNELEHATA